MLENKSRFSIFHGLFAAKNIMFVTFIAVSVHAKHNADSQKRSLRVTNKSIQTTSRYQKALSRGINNSHSVACSKLIFKKY